MKKEKLFVIAGSPLPFYPMPPTLYIGTFVNTQEEVNFKLSMFLSLH